MTGERGHYELAAGRDAKPYIRAFEGFADGGLLAEQVWDQPDQPGRRLFLGRPTGAAMPLVWAHAEYLTLLRSVSDGRVFDLIDEVVERYQSPRDFVDLEVWKPRRHARDVRAGGTLRVLAPAAFTLHWSQDDWKTVVDTQAVSVGPLVYYVNIAVAKDQRAPLRFTMHWTVGGRWEGRDYTVPVLPG